MTLLMIGTFVWMVITGNNYDQKLVDEKVISTMINCMRWVI